MSSNMDTEEKQYFKNLTKQIDDLKKENKDSHEKTDKQIECITKDFGIFKESFIELKTTVKNHLESIKSNENRKWRIVTAIFGGAVIIVAILEIITRL